MCCEIRAQVSEIRAQVSALQVHRVCTQLVSILPLLHQMENPSLSSFFGGGSLIAPEVVLTAAHLLLSIPGVYICI